MSSKKTPYVSRGGIKLAAGLDVLRVDPAGRVCADLGCNVGGFVDCLLQRGAVRVYAVDTGYGVLDWRLRRDPRVVVMERTNALRCRLPEPVDLVTIDVGWTRQRHIVPAAARLLRPGGLIITLIKPHYEAGPHQLRRGILPDSAVEAVLAETLQMLVDAGFEVRGSTESPIRGQSGNREFLALIAPRSFANHADTAVSG